MVFTSCRFRSPWHSCLRDVPRRASVVSATLGSVAALGVRAMNPPSESSTRRPCAHRPSISNRPGAALPLPNVRWSVRRLHRTRRQKTNETPTGQKGPAPDRSNRSEWRYAGGVHDVAIVPGANTPGHSIETKTAGQNLHLRQRSGHSRGPCRFEVRARGRQPEGIDGPADGRGRSAPSLNEKRQDRRHPSLTSFEHRCSSQTECNRRATGRIEPTGHHKRTVRGKPSLQASIHDGIRSVHPSDEAHAWDYCTSRTQPCQSNLRKKPEYPTLTQVTPNGHRGLGP